MNSPGVQPTEDNYREIIAIQEGTSSSLRGKYNEVNAEYQKLLADGSIENIRMTGTNGKNNSLK